MEMEHIPMIENVWNLVLRSIFSISVMKREYANLSAENSKHFTYINTRNSQRRTVRNRISQLTVRTEKSAMNQGVCMVRCIYISLDQVID